MFWRASEIARIRVVAPAIDGPNLGRVIVLGAGIGSLKRTWRVVYP